MKNKTKFLGAVLFTALAFVSCSDDDDATVVVGTPTPGVTAQTRLFATSNGGSSIVNYNLTDLNNITTKTFITANANADGVYYDASTDLAVVANRNTNSLDAYNSININNSGVAVVSDFSSTADMSSPREVTVKGNFYVVANSNPDGLDATADGEFYIYQKSGNSFTLRNVVSVAFDVWSGVFVGDDFYVVVDKTGDLAVFNNFLAANTVDATVAPSKRITIEGITRTHGITFDASTGTGIMTDIATVGVAGAEADGGFHVIADFESKVAAVADGGTLLIAGNQVRVAGSNTMLGNPVDVAFDGSTGIVYIAEAANGKILAFSNVSAGGNLTPIVDNDLSGASSVYLSKE
ncbi:hypothetical protein [Aurantibacter aestuarii]|uniref:NHL repeat containing protein n=1 Tax=Aurantibacter aestuarii TaxID=1266046 RepID=A0A2T1N4X9_9FLAO|nr:hypothetical protein [Aurantibacter aestuarii]PSG86347.1 hypothetical protein C7H52_11680 [Aurantibacter aestuarii]